MVPGRVIPVANAAAAAAYRGRIGDIVVTQDTGAVYIQGNASAPPTQAGTTSGAATSALGVIASAPAATLSNSNNTLTANANGSIDSVLSVIGATVGALVLITVGTAMDGLWTITAVGSGGAPWVLDRPTQYRTFAGLPGIVTIPPGATPERVYVLAAVTPTPTPGTTAIPYYAADAFAYSAATNVTPGAIAPASALGSVPTRVPLMIPVQITNGTNDTPVTVPYACELAGVWAIISTAGGGGSTLALRSAVGGGGTAAATVPTAAPGGAFEGTTVAGTTTPRTLAAGTYYVNRSDLAVRGTLWLTIIKS